MLIPDKNNIISTVLPAIFTVIAVSQYESVSSLKCPPGKSVVIDIAVIRDNLKKWDEAVRKLAQRVSESEWIWASNITVENENIKVAENAKFATKSKELWEAAACLDCKTAGCSAEEVRRLQSYESISTAALPVDKFLDYSYIQTTMENIFATAKVCRPEKCHPAKCLPLDPDLSNILAESDSYCQLQWTWEGWRNETGRKMRGYYTSYVILQNDAAKMNGFKDAKEMWTKAYWRDDKNFFDHFEQAWADVKPLYQQLHAYVRRKLLSKYDNYAKQFPRSRHIPAHLFGNMWAQDWTALYDLVVPFPNAPKVDITNLLKQNKSETADLFTESDHFFQSIGLGAMTSDFWKKSVLTKPDKVEMICHASAWDFFGKSDFRIKMCTQITQEDFQTVHHEMGHIQYYMQYKDQPVEFREGANPGFHEAIGDLIALSVMTPGHLKAIGLLPSDFKEDEETAINTLMNMALQKVAFLPFGYLMDKYRWAVFERKISFADLNAEWWKLRCGMQGVSPPIARTEEDFDAGAKYHIAASVPYDRYFFSHIAQFQFHRAICQRMNVTKDFHLCDIYNQKEAAAPLREALALGSSKPYPEVMKMLTGTEKLDASALLDYFAPLYAWLKEQNKNETETAWSENCPKTLSPSPCGDYSALFAKLTTTTTNSAPTAVARKNSLQLIIINLVSSLFVVKKCCLLLL